MNTILAEIDKELYHKNCEEMAEFLHGIARRFEQGHFVPMRRVGVLMETAEGSVGLQYIVREDRYTTIGLLTVALEQAKGKA